MTDLDAVASKAAAALNKVRHLSSVLLGDRDMDEAFVLDEYVDDHGDVFTRLEALEAESQEQHETNQDLRDRVATLENRLDAIQDLGSKRTTKEEKVARLVTYAQNTAGEDASTGSVLLSVREIRGNADVSTRYAYQLIDDLPDEFEFFTARRDATQYGDAEVDKDDQERGLLVDLGVLHSDEQALNKFINESTREEASA